MPGRLLRYIQVMNALSVFCFVLCCLHNLSLHSNAEPDGGALSVVSQEDDNGEVTVEVNGEDETVPATQTKPREPVDVFYPTHEWQVVKEGQTIPAGLHVRMDFETGVREAKLMEGDSGLKYWKAGQREGGINPDQKTLSMNELKKAIKDFKTTDIDEVDLKREAEVKSKFLSYEELKKDFESMNVGIKTDGEIIEGLVGKLKDNNLDKDQLIITLMDLEYYLHQVDNGILFKDIGGLPLIVKVINSSLDEEVQIEAAMVLGAATSSNPQVQVGAMEAQGLHILLRLLSTHTSVNLQRKIMFAISSLCRHFPHAQKQFLELGGLSVFGKVFEESGMEKIQVKAVSFLNDLLTEKDLIIKDTVSKKSDAVERLRQYDLVPLREAMKEQGWCDRIPKLLHVSEHDSREHVLLTMKTLGQTCKKQFSTSKSNLNNLKLEYTDLAKAEVGDEDKYFTNLLTLISELEHTFKMKEEL